MAKARPPSKHSRAARRAASPSLDVDKSLTSLPRAEKTVLQRESILSDRANAGVSKKRSKPKAKTRAQRERQQKGIERAEAVLDQLEKKVEKSVTRAKVVKSRRTDWADLNRKSSKFDVLSTTEGNDPDDAMVDDSAAPATGKRGSRAVNVVQNRVADEPTPIDEDDEIT